jgi:hypothetical protein
MALRWRRSAHTLADNNLVVDSWAGITTGNQKYGFIDKLNVGGTSNRFQRCVAWGNGSAGAGAGFYAKAGQMKMYHCDAYNNIYGVYIGADTPGSEAPSANVKISRTTSSRTTPLWHVRGGGQRERPRLG